MPSPLLRFPGSTSPAIRLGICLAATLATLYLVASLAHSHYNRGEHGLPAGCDEFGYLNMARAIDAGSTFGNHAERPFIDELLIDLRNQFPTTNHFRWAVAPHAYHIDQSGQKIINQYPPGVGLMLAPLPIEARRVAFPVLCAVIGALALALAGTLFWNGKLTVWPIVLIPALALTLIQFDAIQLELMRVDSLAPTYGLLIASGWLLPKRPGWSLFLLSLTVIFRLPNALLFAPAGLAALFLSEGRERRIQKTIARALKLALPIFLSGFGLYLLYAYLLLGNPFAITYSTLDQAFASEGGLASNLRFYFVDKTSWLGPHLFAIALLLGACLIKPRQLKWFLFGLALIGFNYAFYLSHKVQIDYYPYASSLFCIGLALAFLPYEKAGPRLRIALGAASLALLVYLASVAHPPARNAPESFRAKQEQLQAEFGGYDVVWAEHRSGTVEYATNKAGFRYNWGTQKARSYIMNWLRERGYRQAIWASDQDMPPESEIAHLLEKANIPFEIVESEATGTRFVIPPASLSDDSQTQDPR
ncbi:hypothetical protein [Pelagicoccus sp. SDUM812003]|uniref:hypothetical protein n=1 Tax=Pelagicoccus sp. SDUM812003 TaxID=3041267 RepID=UPI00280DC41E|nr:hypothetical protein [Pelagicoccus sp. SDUM812003]MDQ8202322.1 hypothetical protein [Pelagicoccus sp. SDUM812003]